MNPTATGEIWPIDKPMLWEDNPRSIGKKDFERLKGQIKKHGVYKPLIVDQQGIIVGGNMRYRALLELGAEQVWVSIVQINSEKERLEIALSDNDRAGEYDEEKLAGMVSLYDIDQELYTIDTGKMLSIKDLSSKYGPDPEEDEPPAVAPGEPESKLGEIYQLGPHRLMCGDSVSDEAVKQLMDGKEADMVFTDPPYGVDYEGKTDDKLTIENDKDTEVFTLAAHNFITKPGAAFYVCSPAGNKHKYFVSAFESRCYMSSTLVWVKNSMVLGHGDYHYQHEPILYGWDNRAAHKFYGDRTQTTVWEFDRPSASKEHPTMKPIKLVVNALRNSSQKGDIILDLFGGSGTTLIAAEQSERVCYMMELDPKYCDVIRKRYELFVADKPE